MVKFLGNTLDRSQGLTSIALWSPSPVSKSRFGMRDGESIAGSLGGGRRGWRLIDGERTLNTDMDVLLSILLLAVIFIGFREGVYRRWCVSSCDILERQIQRVVGTCGVGSTTTQDLSSIA